MTNTGAKSETVFARRKKRVVIVDDSRFIRKWLRRLLNVDARLTVVGEAGNAEEARQVIKQTTPDVITLDIEMPGMNGFEFLKKLMALRPMPVVMFAGSTRHNSEAAITALSYGAVDCISKPTSLIKSTNTSEITNRVFSAACSNVQRRDERSTVALDTTQSGELDRIPIILIGASTGGVAALEEVLTALRPNGPPVVVVQHMPGPFLTSFSQHMDRVLPQDVRLARNGELLTKGTIRFAPVIGLHTGVVRKNGRWRTCYLEASRKALYCPSVDQLFKSAYPHAEDVIAAVLTGLGRDGAAALFELKQAGSTTLGQDSDTSVVYGMPKAAFDIGAVEHQVPLHQIGTAINAAVAIHAEIGPRTPK